MEAFCSQGELPRVSFKWAWHHSCKFYPHPRRPGSTFFLLLSVWKFEKIYLVKILKRGGLMLIPFLSIFSIPANNNKRKEIKAWMISEVYSELWSGSLGTTIEARKIFQFHGQLTIDHSGLRGLMKGDWHPKSVSPTFSLTLLYFPHVKKESFFP